ncbi:MULTISPECIES: amidohydrolase [unclassified Frankia]|uniref:amidohydrolase family protein n=1 Tax=unclassified Frankia TaxID=2632575 RepID=UPI0006DC0F8D|nr:MULTISPECIES: amidohydrolase family protein [unclassified Frankia]KQC37426.1 hydrolase [Frankia sp. ACN1ag]KQM05024.1 putative TIM-barrel fold metal-dependent hydrolase [Frankia sp. CpI1-P]
MEHPQRVVDAHVHHWDPARTEWYPFLAADASLAAVGMPDADRMRRPFDQSTYLAEASRWNVEAYVHVTAAPEHFVAETAEIARLAKATGQPQAIIGGVDGRDGAAGIVAQLDAQAGAPGLRGVRASAGLDLDTDTGHALLGALRDRGLVYDLVVHPDGMRAAAAALAAFPDLTVVVEHTGWPLAEDPEHATVWRDGLARLAGLGPRVHLKLSGLAMTLHRIDVASFRPWVAHSLEVFGPARCFFASNFPVDGMFGSFDDLYGTYARLVDELAAPARDGLFAANAARVYRC